MKNYYSITKSAHILLILGIMTLGFTTINAQPKPKYGVMTYNKAINISEKQGMLIQKIAKDYLYMVENSDDEKASRNLRTSKIIFEKQNEILFKNSSNKITKSKIKKVSNLWSTFKKLVESTPNFDSAKKILNLNTDLLKETENVVRSIAIESKNANKMIKGLANDKSYNEKDIELKKIITVSGRQRMLAQRLALYYLANHPTLKDKNSDQMLKNIYNEIDGMNTPLLLSDFDNAEIDEKIANALTIWELIKQDKLRKQGYKHKEIYDVSNKLTRAYNEITTLYEHTKL
ncbi:PilJ/NarX-like methyl-accepting chemotaxis transducer [Aquimarina sp. MAR_2010_214]|uniref:hypothetical protein n=1 Tax=Aquimarina sp. MAR_2010_214 TaxID=1250026 RepID=UPI000C713029|nr:hypothetical protein [Aquimarina sp. MAR_2010_214]PKV51518.1 PilJ/NarX-like methyl-accepting chemotaxis transducer [Aquimarina sp. MAR_2010_214]